MEASFEELVAYLNDLGAEQVAHTQGSFLGHLIGVYRDLQAWGCDEPICRAGMFHSIYGTERFQKFSLPLDRREEVRRLIGEQAERLAYLNCVMDRASFDRAAAQQTGPYRIQNRMTQATHELSAAEFEDLCRIHLCDWLEQVPRCRQWDYRRQAYLHLASRLGEPARAAYDAVFAGETASAQ